MTVIDSRSPFRRARFQVAGGSDFSRDEVRSLPELVGFNAAHNPHHTFCLQEDSKGGRLTRITFAELDVAVRNCAQDLLTRLSGLRAARLENNELRKVKPVAILLESGIGMFVHVVALLSLGVPVAVLSARLNATSIEHLRNEVGFQHFVTSDRLWSIVSSGLTIERSSVHFAEAINTSSMENPQDFPLAPVLEDDCNAIILHSSGTTGLPKAIRHPQRYLLVYAACHEFESGRYLGDINLSTLPLYHGFGMLAPALSLSVGKPCCFPSSVNIPTAASTLALIRASGAKSLFTVPSILEDISKSDDEMALSDLQALDFIVVGGGPLKPTVGEWLRSKGVKVLNHFGATELGPLAPVFYVDGTDYHWPWLRIRKDYKLNLTPVDPAVAVPGTESLSYKLTGIPPGQSVEWSLSDCFERRSPETRDVRLLNRTDDVIVLSNGEKVMPQKLELALSELPQVKAALAFGSGQFEIGVIIQPSFPITSPGVLQSLVDVVWDEILCVNQTQDSHAQILYKEAIIILPNEVVFPRSDKGSIMRAESYRLFKHEIDQAYHTLSKATVSAGVGQDWILDPKRIQDSLEKALTLYLDTSKVWSVTDDFFELGLDSLRTTRLQRLISAQLAQLMATPPDLTGVIYHHPTIISLTTYIERVLGGVDYEVASNADPSICDDELQQLITSFATDPMARQMTTMPHGSRIVLTGSTGSIGSHLLLCLLQYPNVAEVICLDRHRDTGNRESELLEQTDNLARHKIAFQKHGISVPDSLLQKLNPIATDTKANRLGLNKLEYRGLVSSTTHIIHNAWPMDFMRTPSSFKDQYASLRNLLQLGIDAAKSSNKATRFIFHSSIAVLANYHEVMGTSGHVPEIALTDSISTSSIGYAKAKWVCEKMLEEAATSFPDCLEASIIRIGQISGSTSKGAWSEKEHIPALLRTAKNLNCMPKIDGTFSWLPVDKAAQSISEIAINTQFHQMIYHVENPQRQDWADTLSAFHSILQIPDDKQHTLDFEQWLSVVERKLDNGSNEDVLKKYPIASLIPFFRHDFKKLGMGRTVLSTTGAVKASPSLTAVGPVEFSTLENYVHYWKHRGFM